MSKLNLFLTSLAVMLVAVGLTGCPKSDDATTSDDADETSDDADDGSDTKDDSAATDDEAKKKKFLADLSEEDRAAVEKQQTCPVSGSLLWNMAKPCKMTVTDSQGKDHEVFLCCESCKPAVEKDPDGILAELE